MSRYDLGCGEVRREGFIRVDINPATCPDVVADIRDLSVLAAGLAEAISCMHVLEHLPHPGQLTALRQMARLLAPGGTVEIKVPHPSHDSAMVPGHYHVIPPHYWRQIKENPAAWMGDPWFTIDEVVEVADEDLITASGMEREVALRCLRNVVTETLIRGHRA